MQNSLVKSLLVIFSYVLVHVRMAACVNFEYTGYKLYRVTPENDTQLEVLLILRNSNSGLFFWNGIDNIGDDVDILVSPDVRSFFLEHMISHNVLVKEYFSDVKISMGHKTISMSLTTEPTVDGNPTTPTPITIVPSAQSLPTSNISVPHEEVELVPIQNVSGSSLLTGTFYTIGMRRYPRGFVTWAEKSTGYGNYVQIDFKAAKQDYYAHGGKLYNDAQWMILPTEDKHLFQLVNRGIPNGIFTWTYEKSPNGHFVQLASPKDKIFYLPGQKWRNDGILYINATELSDHYILQIRTLPQGLITWTNKYGSSNNKYLQVDISPDAITNYRPEQIWRDDVLFKFAPLKKMELVGTITQFHYNLLENNTVLPTQPINMFSKDKVKIPNNSGVTQSLHLKHTKSITNNYHFQFKQQIDYFANISCKASIPYRSTTFVDLAWPEHTDPRSRQELEKSQVDTFSIDVPVQVLPHKTLHATWHSEWVENFMSNFTAQIAVNGFVERMTIDRKIYHEPVPVDDVLNFLRSENIECEIAGVKDNRVILKVEGTFTGSYVIKDVFLTTNV